MMMNCPQVWVRGEGGGKGGPRAEGNKREDD